MKKTETKYYCDFCHKECTHEHYDMRLPYLQKRQYPVRDQRDRLVIDPSPCILKNKYNLCRKCATRVGEVCEFLPKFCMNDGMLAQTTDRLKEADGQWNCFSNSKPKNNKYRMVLEYEE